jgi:hypothetical protein
MVEVELAGARRVYTASVRERERGFILLAYVRERGFILLAYV